MKTKNHTQHYTQSIRKDATNYTSCSFALFLQASCLFVRAKWDETARQPDRPTARPIARKEPNDITSCSSALFLQALLQFYCAMGHDKQNPRPPVRSTRTEKLT